MGKGERRKQGRGCEGEDEGLGQMTSFEVLLMAVTKLSGRRKTRGGRGREGRGGGTLFSR